MIGPINKPNYITTSMPPKRKTIKEFERWIKFELHKTKNSIFYDMGRSISMHKIIEKENKK